MILVPKIFHRIWLGPDPMPMEFVDYGRSWLKHHPGWEMHLHSAGTWPTRYPELIAKCDKPSQAANIYRYEILQALGGVYIDTDFECRKNIEPLIEDEELFVAHQVDNPMNPGYLNNAFIGCTPGHPVMTALLLMAPGWTGPTTGPTLLTYVMKAFAPRILPKKFFYPYAWDELDRANEAFPEAYAIHRWGSGTRPFTSKRTIRM